ncbi:DUF2339 domain-containing protein [Acetivibrio thermocellus]|uniref:DUF2339 domain-containing protein n=1 Tax=Acetivibrio thermocellus TaxID=1515 RepID=UPI0021AD9F11|nr:DUF2339 domain-containing protein [Acetivibrio thermocellus]UWV48255.1 DUF2339 domain-containing protein [Acetivibrio thermocellus]
MTNNLKIILAKQKEIITSLENEIAGIEANDLVKENQKLKEELAKLKSSLEKEKIENEKLSKENKNLRNILYEQFYNEKISLLNSAEKRMDVYYRAHVEGEINRLTRFELSVKRRIDEMTKVLRANRVSLQDEIYIKLEELRNLLNVKITKAREEIMQQTGAFIQNRNEGLARLRQEQVTEQEIKARAKQNNIESIIGLNIINKVGIFLLIVGVITAAQFTYFRLPDTLKSVFTFAVGVVLLIAGEILNRKKPNVFSLGITSGGIAILYVALCLSYFQFKLLETYPALGLCILITAGTFVLSQRYNSQTISAFALIGGYLPIFSITGISAIAYGAMVYFVILNLLALIIAVNKKWAVTAYIGFVLNVIGSVYIASIMFGGLFAPSEFSFDSVITIIYILFAFVIYTLIPIAGTFRQKLSFKTSDIVLLALNTFISSVLLYWSFYASDLEDFTGLLALTFAIIYLALGRFIEKNMPKENQVTTLFYLTGLTFVVLIIPFQFGKVWLSLGWLIEGVALLSYGICKEIKRFKKAGIAISFLCLLTFLSFDVSLIQDSLFTFKYFAITLGSIIILGALIYKKNLASKESKLFKYATSINLLIFLLYIISNELKPFLSQYVQDTKFDLDYLICSAMILTSFLVAYTLPRIKVLCDNVIKGISMSIYALALLTLFSLNFTSPVKGYLVEMPLAISIVGTLELALIAFLSILAVRDFVLYFVIDHKLGIEWYPLAISLYFVIILTQNLITQYRLEFSNAAISIIYLAAALTWIIFGFAKRYVFIRRFGLAMSMLSVAKLFIIDLAFLTQGYRIVSYFVFGIILLAISFVYQYFNKKLENICEVMPDDKKNSN